jgi:hypothetical protein
MKAEVTKIPKMTDAQRTFVNFLSPQQRLEALVREGRKAMEIAMMTDEQRAEKNEQLKSETMNVTTLSEQDPACAPGPYSWGGRVDGTQMVSYQQLDGWYGVLQGATDGNWWEGEVDQGPYPTREDVEAFLRDDYEHPEEEMDVYAGLEE